MSRPRGVRRFFRLRPRRDWVEDSVDLEIQHHIDSKIDELVARGVPTDEARRVAEDAFGDLSRYRAACIAEQKREVRMTWWREVFGGVVGNVRWAVRGLSRSPGYVVAIVLTLGLGIGANTAIFTVVDALMLRPVSFERPEELQQIMPSYDDYLLSFFDPETAQLWAREASFLSPMSMYAREAGLRTDGAEPQTLTVVGLSPGSTDILGVAPVLGRSFNRDDAIPGAGGVALVSQSFWISEWGSETDPIGRELTLDGRSYEVVGVMPRKFHYPTFGRTDVWVPLADDMTMLGRSARQIQIVFRADPEGVDALTERMKALVAGWKERDPKVVWTPELSALNQPRVNPDVRRNVWVTFGAVAILLLVALVNGINLTIARGTTRVREIGIRLALGGGRGRIARQLLTESLVLALFSGIVAVGLALLGVDALSALAPRELTYLGTGTIDVDGRVIAFAGVLTVTVGFLFGLLPALRTVKVARATSGTSLSVYGATTGGRHRLRAALVVAQVAMSLVLLFGAALLGRSFATLVASDPGFEPDGLARLEFTMAPSIYPTGEARTAMVTRVMDRLRGLPGVRSVALSGGLPPNAGISFGNAIYVAGRAEPVVEGDVFLPMTTGGPNLRATLGTALIAGRDFLPSDDPAARIALVSEPFARVLAERPELAVGKRFRIDDGVEWEVTGVIEDLKLMGLDERFGDFGMISLMGDPSRMRSWASIAVRYEGDPALVFGEMRSAMREIDALQPIRALGTLDDALWESVDKPRFFLTLMAVFAGVALSLAGIGLYGVLSFAVNQRRREMGIRLALGANVRDVRTFVMRRGLRMAVGGAVIGVGVALWMARLLEAMLFETSSWDLPTLVAVMTVMLGIASLASWVPARRATRVDPVEVLKSD